MMSLYNKVKATLQILNHKTCQLYKRAKCLTMEKEMDKIYISTKTTS